MKKTAIILAALTIFSCNKEESLPEPQARQTQTQAVESPIVEESKLEGHYICNEWDMGRGDQDKMEIFLYEMNIPQIGILLNQYIPSGEVFQLFSTLALCDENSFDTKVTIIPQSFRGYLVNDSTLSVTLYTFDSVGQTKNFIRQ